MSPRRIHQDAREAAGEGVRPVPLARRVWGHLPWLLRRPITRIMRSERIRLKVLSILRIRPESGFFTLSPGGVKAIGSALQELAWAGVAGDYYEFGVYRGYTLWHAQQVADHYGLTDMRFFGFDSFEGLPEVEGADRDAAVFIAGDYRCARQEVEGELTQRGFDWARGALIEGYFDTVLTDDTKARFRMGPAALVMLDCDLYQSVVPALDFLADMLQDGTIMLFDDWDSFGASNKYGSRRAFQEFLAAHPGWTAEERMPFLPYGQAFLMRRTTPTDAGSPG